MCLEGHNRRTTSSWQKYSNRKLCHFCKKNVARWVFICNEELRCDECVPKTRRSFLKEGIDPMYDEFGNLINLPADYGLIKKSEKSLPDIGWEFLENGILLEDTIESALLQKFINESGLCPECFTLRGGIKSKHCRKCGYFFDGK